MSGGLEISGGVGGVVAERTDLRTLQTGLEALGSTLGRWVLADADEAMDPDLLASAALAPQSFLRAQAAILAATTGPGGLGAEAATLEMSAAAVRSTDLYYALADETAERASGALLNRLGGQIEQLLPGIVAGGLLATVLVPGAGRSLTARMQRHPELVQGMAGVLPGVLQGARDDPGVRAGTWLGARLGPRSLRGVLTDAYDGIYGPARRGRLAADQPRTAMRLPAPTGVRTLLTATDRVSRGLGSGGFAVQRIQHRDGASSWVVQLPGTDSDDPGSVRDWTGNIHLLEGRDTAYGEAIDKALVNAGAGREEPVLLSGHSAGGMQAARLAADPEFRWNVKGVLTAAAPIGGVRLPDSVATLSLENTRDLVVGLDGRGNGEGIGQVTVRSDLGGADVSGAHSLSQRYLPLAEAVDAGRDPSTEQILTSWRENGFLVPGQEVSTRTFTYRAVLE